MSIEERDDAQQSRPRKVIPGINREGAGQDGDRRAYGNAVAVIDFMLDDLRGPAGEGLEPYLHFLVLILRLDRLPAAG